MTAIQARKRKLTYFIGVDVSRNKLDIAVRDKQRIIFHQEVVNAASQIAEHISGLKKLEKFRMRDAIFCMEDAGYYVNPLLKVLRRNRTNIHLGNPTQVKNSLGIVRDKSDRLDAIRIANYAYRHHDELTLWEPKRKEIDQLSALVTVRARMITTIGMIRVPLKDQRAYIDRAVHKQVVDCCKNSLAALVGDLNLLEKSILKLVHSDPKLKRFFDIICSVPYVGPVTAVQIIICTNEFLKISCPRKFACYAGVAPFKQESGIMTGKARGRVSKFANKKMKKLLHICAVGSIRRQGEFRDYYQRRCAEGKLPMIIINAIRNKIIRRIFSCIKHDRLYQNVTDFQRSQNEVPSGQSPATTRTVPLRKRTKFANRTMGTPL